jgi:hypothetical protein
MAEPLNPVLYRALKHKFGDVKIANEGCSAYYERLSDPLNPRRTVVRASTWGEYYCVRCPFCNDHSQRLWINHRYGTELNYGRLGLTHLAVCYNNQCLKTEGRLSQLEQLIFGVGQHLKPKPLTVRAATTNFTPTAVTPPGEIALLNELPNGHPARTYIESRGFDPDWLAMQFQIGVCMSASEPKFEIMRNRLYIPVTFRHELVGWQCRAVGAARGPKYLNAPNMRKSALLYNFDNAATQGFVVVVEGVPSVWRLGCGAVCLFGKSMSMLQQNLIASNWANKPVFLMLDNDAAPEMEQARQILSQRGMTVVPVQLPDARDPADYDFSSIVDILLSSAEANGVLAAIV